MSIGRYSSWWTSLVTLSETHRSEKSNYVKDFYFINNETWDLKHEIL